MPGQFQAVAVPAVTTRCLRAVFDASGDGDIHAGVGVQEWEALAPRSAAPPAEPDERAAPCER